MASICRSLACAALFCAALAPAFAAETDARPGDFDIMPEQVSPAAAPPDPDSDRELVRQRRLRYANIDWAERRERFERMQNTGYNLMMGGVACGVGGIVLMAYGINQLENSSNHYDRYGNRDDSPDGLIPFAVGYVSLLAGFPGLMTTGIILNRIGNHKRIQAEEMLGGGARFDIGPNSLKVSYSF